MTTTQRTEIALALTSNRHHGATPSLEAVPESSALGHSPSRSSICFRQMLDRLVQAANITSSFVPSDE